MRVGGVLSVHQDVQDSGWLKTTSLRAAVRPSLPVVCMPAGPSSPVSGPPAARGGQQEGPRAQSQAGLHRTRTDGTAQGQPTMVCPRHSPILSQALARPLRNSLYYKGGRETCFLSRFKDHSDLACEVGAEYDTVPALLLQLRTALKLRRKRKDAMAKRRQGIRNTRG